MHWKRLMSVALVIALSLQSTISIFAETDLTGGWILDEDEWLSTPSDAESTPSNAESTPSNADKKATASNAVRQEAFSITTVSGYGQIEIKWDEVAGATGYSISRSATSEGEYKKTADVAADKHSYTDSVGTGAKWFYKVTATTPDGKEESTAAEADYTSIKSLKENAVIHKAFPIDEQHFDGTRVVNLSEEDGGAAEALQDMDRGTVIMKVRVSEANSPVGVILGLKEDEAPIPSSEILANESLTGTKTAAIMMRERGIRYSFGHTRANGSENLTDAQWTTVVFTNAEPDASKVLRLYVGGKAAGYFSGSNNAGFFSKTGCDTDNASVTIGGLIAPDGTISDGFQGEIASVTVTDELLTDREAQEISQGAAESDILRAFSLADASNSWVITGGRNAQGKYEDIGEVRNYAGLFEEVIRWDQSENSKNGLQRFVVNTAQDGLTIDELAAEHDALIAAYSPKGVAVMLGADDLELSVQEVMDSLSALIEKNSEMLNPAYTVIQLPVPSLDTAENNRIEMLSAAISDMVSELDYLIGKQVVVVDHYTQMKSMDMENLLNDEGFLNAKGHLAVANQLLGATIGSSSNVTDADLERQAVKGPALYEEQPELLIGDSSITIQAPSVAESWTYDLDIEGTVIHGTMKQSTFIGKLPKGLSFTLTIISDDKTLKLPVMAGIIGEGQTADVWNQELTDSQQELQARLESSEALKWLFVGDRITQGAADTAGHGSAVQLFEKYIRDELGRTKDVVINTGVSGATAQDYQNNKEVRFERYADADVVVIMFGTEDARSQVGTGSYQQTLESIVDEVRENGAVPVIRTPNKLTTSEGGLGNNLSKYVRIARNIAEEKDVVLVDHYDLWEKNLYAQAYLNRNEYWQNGDIYPNAIGQLKMAQDFIQAIGMNTQESEICGLDYPVKSSMSTRGMIPPVNSTTTSIRVNAEHLQKQAGEGLFGSVTVTAVSEGMTYTKTFRRTSPEEIKSVELEYLPTGQNYTLTVEASLLNAPKTIRFQSRKFILDGTVNDFIPSEVEGLIYEKEELTLDGTMETIVDLSSEASTFQALTEGTLSFRFRVANPEQSSDGGLQTLFSISDSSKDDTYAAFYVQPNSGVIGLEMKQAGETTIYATSGTVNMKNKDWHTATFVSDTASNTMNVYVDGEAVISTSATFFLNIAGSDSVRLGNLRRQRGDHLWALKGDINLFQVYDRPLTAEEVRTLQQPTILEREDVEIPDTAKKTEPIDLFYGGFDDSSHYRIPALLTTEAGTVIAAIDQRRSGSGDHGDIATVIRRSTDGGKTWGDVQNLIDLPAGEARHAFTIDASMVQDRTTGRIFLLVDMFPESTALMSGSPISLPTSGYKEVDGTRYLILKNGNDTYTLRDGGLVYLENNDGESVLTDYTVPNQHSGEIYNNGTPAGNIYLYTGENAGALSVIKTSYLWLISSDDDGATWSDPVCINGQVKKEWMVFLGTGPGVGIQIEQGEYAGRLVFPVYHSNDKGLGGSQSSAVIYSDDNGVTWEIGESPNDGRDGMSAETMNDANKVLTESQVVEVGSEGMLKLFCRNWSRSVMVATSIDGGVTWDDNVVPETDVYDSYCQLSIVPYPEPIDGKPAYVLSNPASYDRNNGTVRIGLYDEDRDSFEWKYSQLIHEGKFQYSCIAIMPNGEIGVFYEGDQPYMRFTRMTLDWITAPRFDSIAGPAITGVEMEQLDYGMMFTVTFNRPMMKMGEPVLKLKADGVAAEAAYVSGSAENQYQFFYIPTGTEQELVVTNVAAEGMSYIGDVHNDLPKDVAFRFSLKEEEKNLGQVKNELENVLNDSNATAAQKQEAATKAAAELQRLDLGSIGVGSDEMETIAYIEHAYIWNNPNVLATVINSSYVRAAVRGAALTVPADSAAASRIVVDIKKAPIPSQLPEGLDRNAMTAFDVRMDLEQSSGVTKDIQPLVPFELTFELPANISPKGLIVIQYHNGEMEPLSVSISGNKATVMITRLSTFVIANKKVEEQEEPQKPGKPSGSGGGGASSSAVPSGPVSLKGNWIKSDIGWWFEVADGTYPKDSWAYIGGFWYHFNLDGYMQTGWFLDKDLKWYYLKESGAMASAEWVKDQEKWYYLNSDGAMAVNTVIGGMYSVGSDGVWTNRD